MNAHYALAVDKLSLSTLSNDNLLVVVQRLQSWSLPQRNTFLADLATVPLAGTQGTHLSQSVNLLSLPMLDAWKGFINAPSNLRTKLVILEKADQLLSSGSSVSITNLDAFSGTLQKLKSRSISDADLEKIAEHALEARKFTNRYAIYNIETDLFKQIAALASSNRFINVSDLKLFLSEQQLLQNLSDNPGNLEQLNEAVKVMLKGDEVILEGKDILKGDIVNISKKESIQLKVLTATAESTVITNLNKAADQFSTEPAAAGYKKIAQVKVLNSLNPYYAFTALDIRNKLQLYVDRIINQQNIDQNRVILSNLWSLDQIRIENVNGLFKFKLINSLIVIQQI